MSKHHREDVRAAVGRKLSEVARKMGSLAVEIRLAVAPAEGVAWADLLALQASQFASDLTGRAVDLGRGRLEMPTPAGEELPIIAAIEGRQDLSKGVGNMHHHIPVHIPPTAGPGPGNGVPAPPDFPRPPAGLSCVELVPTHPSPANGSDPPAPDWRTTPIEALKFEGPFPDEHMLNLCEDCEIADAGEAWKLLEEGCLPQWTADEAKALELALVALRHEAGDPAPCTVAIAEAEEVHPLARPGGPWHHNLTRPADGEVHDEELRLAISGYRGHEGRWAELASKGATDAELKWTIGKEMLDGGGTGLFEGRGYRTRSGKNPALWIPDYPLSKVPTLGGAKLVRRVRQLLAIPSPSKAPKVQGRSIAELESERSNPGADPLPPDGREEPKPATTHTYEVHLADDGSGNPTFLGECGAGSLADAEANAPEWFKADIVPGTPLVVRPGKSYHDDPGMTYGAPMAECRKCGQRWRAADGEVCPSCGPDPETLYTFEAVEVYGQKVPGHVQFRARNHAEAQAKIDLDWPGQVARAVPASRDLASVKGSDGRPKSLPSRSGIASIEFESDGRTVTIDAENAPGMIATIDAALDRLKAGRPPAEPAPKVPMPAKPRWRVLDTANGMRRELETVEATSADAARRRARANHKGLRHLAVERIAGP